MRRRDVLRAGAGLLAASTLPAVSASRADYAPTGRLDIEGTAEVVVGGDGRTAYVAADDGFAVVDLSDPAAPRIVEERRELLADREDGPLHQIKDVAVEGDRLIVAGPAQNAALRGFLVYDVSEPTAPERLTFYETRSGIHNAYLHDGVVYYTANNGRDNPVVLVDVTGDEPAEVGWWSPVAYDQAWNDVNSLLRVIHDIHVDGDLGYFSYWDAGVFVVDVSDPSDPTYVNRIGDYDREYLAELSQSEVSREYLIPEGNAHYAAVDETGTLLGIGAESWAVGTQGGPSGIDLWDVSDPEDPTHLSTLTPPRADDEGRQGTYTTAHNFSFVGDRLYTSWYQGGVQIHDVSDPTSPERLTWWRDPERAAFWAARGEVAGDFFVASSHPLDHNDTQGGVYVFPDEAGEQASPSGMVYLEGNRPTTTDSPTTDVTTAATDDPTPTTRTTAPPTSVITQPLTTTLPPTTSPPATSPATSPPATSAMTTDSPTTETTTAETDGQPGFGVLAALSALGAAAWRRRR